jgi:hypothetical protein
MADTEAQVRAPYEQALRVIGRFLDAEPTYHLSVVEDVDGFIVRAHSSRFKSDGRTVNFTWDRLNDLLVYHTAGRGLSRRPHRHRGLWDDFPNGHEDFFRALGHDLDEESAVGLSVDEVPEGITVSYRRPRSSGADDYETVNTVMRKEEIQRLLEAAQARRVAGRQ